jgi:hypothetical protein
VHQSQLRGWVKALADDPQHAFPGQGQMKPEQLEIVQLKREVIRLKAERDILKKAAAYFAKDQTVLGVGQRVRNMHRLAFDYSSPSAAASVDRRRVLGEVLLHFAGIPVGTDQPEHVSFPIKD